MSPVTEDLEAQNRGRRRTVSLPWWWNRLGTLHTVTQPHRKLALTRPSFSSPKTRPQPSSHRIHLSASEVIVIRNELYSKLFLLSSSHHRPRVNPSRLGLLRADPG